jgi:two-component system nitrate/nitrite sensor histidine kinase NarX
MLKPRWSLSAKITLFAGIFLMLSLTAVGYTLWVAWNLQGGAAAVNEAGRMRMLSYSIALTAAQPDHAALPGAIAPMQRSLDLLQAGDEARPLFVPWDPLVRARYARVVSHWQALRARYLAGRPAVRRVETDAYVADIDALVTAIEERLDFWSDLLHTAQLAMAGLVVLGTMLMFFAAYLLVLDPVGRLGRGVAALARGDYTTRVDVGSSDELGDLAQGFNSMAGELQRAHAELEQRVRMKTADLQTERHRLAALYEISALVARAQSLDELAETFTRSVQRIAGADAAALRWTDEAAQRYLLLAGEGMPESLTEAERCLLPGACYCGRAGADAGPQVVRFADRTAAEAGRGAEADAAACARAGFRALVSVPVAAQQRLLGELDLLYRRDDGVDPEQHALLTALAGHLAAAMESLRSAALEREAVVARERNLLARELHDSIAQALAFMKIQLQILRTAIASTDATRVAAAVDELDAGVRESLADVRELLLHFRTRTQAQDIEPALRSTLQKFELQSGVQTRLEFNGRGQPLDPDIQVQVLHILLEALSNVRKHARAAQVAVAVSSDPHWRFAIRDNGVGFDPGGGGADALAHVGLQIMQERAANIGATLRIDAAPGRGVEVVLQLGAAAARPPATATEAADVA